MIGDQQALCFEAMDYPGSAVAANAPLKSIDAENILRRKPCYEENAFVELDAMLIFTLICVVMVLPGHGICV